ncbi:hypothetical protein ZWY2020_025704 [Hordeum vulgare]|nr:hypothetical protein ZWY2020_025704 [Hordeum vulgare]
MSKFATPPPARNLDMSLVLDDATSAAHDAYDDAMQDTAFPLGAFLDAQIARVAARCHDTSETADTIEVEPPILRARTSSPMPELPDTPECYVMEGEIAEDFLASTLFTSEEKICHYYILKLFPFLLKDDAKTWFTSLASGCVRSPEDMVYYFSEKYFPSHKMQAASQEIYNFAQAEEESLPQPWGRLVQLLNDLRDHPLEKNEILDIFHNGLIDASKDHLDSYVGCVFRERTVEQAEILLTNILCNENAWTIPKPPPKTTPKTRGILFLSPEDMQEAKKSMEEKCIKSEDVKNLPPIEEIHGLDNPIQVVEVNSLRRNVNDLKLLSKPASMVTTQVEQVLKAQNDLLNEFNDNSIKVVTRRGRMTQEPLYPEGHPKRTEQDSQGVSTDAPRHPRKKKKDDRNLHASNPVAATPESPNDASISDAETQSSYEHEPNDNINSDVHVDAQPSNDKDVETEPVDLDNP